MRTETTVQSDTTDFDLDLRIADVAEQTEEFGRGTYTSPSSYAIGTRCPVCC
ncbi:SCO0268 family class II lanthipeptide [Kitasatospora cineracea]|uniref:Lantipeptide (TIGR04451 family) n=1 Tax=Kitasatospora cineracea TaxID=88074 RepID=A0A3N4R5K2_9ACTN|nr:MULTISPECIES: SCO0268 family class II lanthipeptide [Kitasatospora]ROR37767.1 lantipeptide (TIGR04451 family) [Kitasatospora cineracea]RPE28813.1 lantipeptide (TIGR04451 family) [Kitasatospora cineracea]WAL75059.1 SCO0268 family class II lanthipeptide [Kitasatospora sp. YST-16]WNW41116.1 SCO0268 family class II lanthipeptide [Streptomyces sp. Li-HN-5-13]